MKNIKNLFIVAFLSIAVFSCKKKQEQETTVAATNDIEYANGLAIYTYDKFTVVKVLQPWAGADKEFTYVLYKENGLVVPDSLRKFPQVKVPIDRVIATSTTHLPSLVALGEEQTLVGFPGLDYISSQPIRDLINAGSVKELGQNEQMNTELALDLEPTAIVAFAMDDNNAALHTIQQSGIPVIYNGDWVEQTPLGKAEWIKLFGALYGKEAEAKLFFDNVTKNYNKVLELVKDVTEYPTVMSGAMYQDVWYLPQGQSWVAMYFKDAKADYLWKDSEGTGSLSLSFEAVYDKAAKAKYWVNPAQFETLADMQQANPHYAQFDAFKSKNVFSFAPKKGEKGGSVFYEYGPNRPDLVLKDLVYIFHPEVLGDEYKPTFYEQLK